VRNAERLLLKTLFNKYFYKRSLIAVYSVSYSGCHDARSPESHWIYSKIG
jgi:hypothetical protein